MPGHIRRNILETFSSRSPVTFSIGAATYLEPPHAIDEAVQQADKLMYSVKRSGKNRLLHKEFRGAFNG